MRIMGFIKRSQEILILDKNLLRAMEVPPLLYIPVLCTVSLLSPSVYYTHDFRPKNREW